jgi:hypothetical protein
MADSITTLQPDNTLVTFIQNTEPLIGVIEPDVDIINITTEFTTIEVTTLGTQGMVGAKGEKGDKGDIGNPLEFDLLTEQQKLELRGDVGDTSVNYTNIFYDSLLS